MEVGGQEHRLGRRRGEGQRFKNGGRGGKGDLGSYRGSAYNYGIELLVVYDLVL